MTVSLYDASDAHVQLLGCFFLNLFSHEFKTDDDAL